MKATVLVRPKAGILDPQGEAVHSSLRHLGFAVGDTRVGRLIDVEVDEQDPVKARELVDEMCRKLLANLLIESYEIELPEHRGGGSTEPPKSADGGLAGGEAGHSSGGSTEPPKSADGGLAGGEAGQ